MTPTTTLIRCAAAVAALALAVGACSSGEGADPVTTSLNTVATTSTTSPDVRGGWIGGAPDWTEASDGSPGPATDSSTERSASGEVEVDESTDEGPVGRPAPGPDLRAGSVDDNAEYPGFLDYLDRIAGIGISTRELDARDRSVITVRTADGRPAAGTKLTIAGDDQRIEMRTTADGMVRFLPDFAGMPETPTFDVSVLTDSDSPVTVELDRGADIIIDVPNSDAPLVEPVPLDVLFLLDSTGSMGDEIDRLKSTIDTVAARLTELDPAPDVRFAMTLYRDEGDAFVTANHEFTGDVDAFRAALAEVVAEGGGDYPEALDEGLADALAKPAWRDPAETVQLIFLVADAPPQVGRQVDVQYTDSIRDAVERGIKIFPIASSESDDQAEAVFRQIAQATGAPFVFLSNGAGGASTGTNTDIESTDYEELSLDELVVRLIAEELSDLAAGAGGGAGGDVAVPTTVTPSTTDPEGQ